jgi:chemotaxis protein CheD
MKPVDQIYIGPGDLMVTDYPALLNSTPLGSCIAVIAYLKSIHLGAMAHIMLPGKPLTANNNEDLRYAVPGIKAMFSKVFSASGVKNKIPVAIIGGANVLKKDDDLLTPAIIESVIRCIREHNGQIIYEDLGGTLRRSVILNTQSGDLFVSVGNKHSKKVVSL